MRGEDVEIVYLLFTLLCPLSMLGLMAWWGWSMRSSSGGSGSCDNKPVRSAAEDSEIVRMRAQLDQLEAKARDDKAPTRA
jgi:hypothetical protein